MANRGKKDCPNCKQEIGARCLVCPLCGYHYESKTIRKDLLKKEEKKETPVYNEGGKGKKECPKCHVYMGARQKECPACGFIFGSSVEKNENIETKEQPQKEVKKEIDETQRALNLERKRHLSINHTSVKFEQKKMTPQDYARDVLKLGRERATNLCNLHRWGVATWSHVDWKLVETELEKMVA